jgi:4'-phosphopantetheinyl transferase
MLRLVLSNYLGLSPDKILFNYGINKKPIVEEGANLQFNVSYSHNWIIIAVSSEPVGVDIEFINPDFDYLNVMESCFMTEEIDTIKQASQPQKVFFQSWTRKEALLKATSLGLDDYLKDFSCLDGMQKLPKKLGAPGDWRIKSFLMEKEYQVSLAQEQLQTIRYCNNDLIHYLTA